MAHAFSPFRRCLLSIRHQRRGGAVLYHPGDCCRGGHCCPRHCRRSCPSPTPVRQSPRFSRPLTRTAHRPCHCCTHEWAFSLPSRSCSRSEDNAPTKWMGTLLTSESAPYDEDAIRGRFLVRWVPSIPLTLSPAVSTLVRAQRPCPDFAHPRRSSAPARTTRTPKERRTR